MSRCDRLAAHVLAGVLLLNCCRAAPARAQSCLDYSRYSHWVACVAGVGEGNEVSGVLDVALAGDRAYALLFEPSALVVVDVGQPRAPVTRGRLALGRRESQGRVAAAGTRACVATPETSLVFVDASDPDAPRETARLNCREGWGAPAMDDSLVVVGRGRRLVLISFAGDGSARERGSLELPAPVVSVAISGGIAYALVMDGATRGLQVVDLADPDAPRLRGELPLDREPLDLDVAGGWAFLAVAPGRLAVVDVADPAAPRLAWAGADSDSTRPYRPRVRVRDGLACVELDRGVSVYDVTSPARPAARETLWCPGYGFMSATGMALADGHLLMATVSGQAFSEPGGLHVFALAGPEPPPLRAVLPGFPHQTGGVVLNGDHAYLDDGVAISVVAVGDPGPPALRTRVETPEPVWELRLADGHLCARGAWDPGRDGVRIYDLVDPDRPSPRGRVTYPVRRRGPLVAAGSRLYSETSDSVLVIETADPDHPRVVGSVPSPGDVSCAAAGGGLVCFGRSDHGIAVYGLDDPVQPRLLGVVPEPGQPTALCLAEGTLFAASHNAAVDGGLQPQVLAAWDLKDPTAPRLLARVGTQSFVRALASDGGALYATIPYGLLLYDARVAAQLHVAGSLEQRFVPGGVQAVGGRVALAGRIPDGAAWSGFALAWADCRLLVPTTISAFTAVVENGTVVLRWALPEAAPTPVLRLTGRHGPRAWNVPITVVPGVGGWARDDSPELKDGGAVAYALDRRDDDGGWLTLATREVSLPAPVGLRLVGVAPNPFNPQVTIAFTVDRPQDVTVEVYDLAGRRVAQLARGQRGAGSHAIVWNGRGADSRPLASGAYLVTLRGEHGRDARRLSLVR